jgi:hypothetical protein
MLKPGVLTVVSVLNSQMVFHKIVFSRRSDGWRRRIAASAAIIGVIVMGDVELSAAPRKNDISYRVDGDFAGKKPGKPAKDLSGVACMPPMPDGRRVCLFVNDESRHAQFAVLKDGTITPGETIDLVGDKPGDGVLGSPPEANCPAGEGEFGEFDGEGVAYAEPYFYVVGSHGCGRRTGKFVLSSFLLARIRVDAEGRPADNKGKALPQKRWSEAVELTYRLSDSLRSAKVVGKFFGISLDEENGLNVEGVAIDGTRLLAGLRAPSVGGRAFLVAADLQSLFAPGHEPSAHALDVIPLALGDSIGIRDLASLPDGRLLVLAGPAQDQELPYRILIAEPHEGGAMEEIDELEPVTDQKGRPAKAEALAVLGNEDKELRVLVLFDGLQNGGPVERRLPLR